MRAGLFHFYATSRKHKLKQPKTDSRIPTMQQTTMKHFTIKKSYLQNKIKLIYNVVSSKNWGPYISRTEAGLKSSWNLLYDSLRLSFHNFIIIELSVVFPIMWLTMWPAPATQIVKFQMLYSLSNKTNFQELLNNSFLTVLVYRIQSQIFSTLKLIKVILNCFK